MELPGTAWREAVWGVAEARDQAPAEADWVALPGLVRHTFTHFHLELAVWAGRTAEGGAAAGRWVPLDALAAEALPSLMRKVVRHALEQAAPVS